MGLLKAGVYGFLSGLTEFFPVSSDAHRLIIMYLFGESYQNSMMDAFVHLGVLFGLFIACRPYFTRLLREQKLIKRMRRQGRRNFDPRGIYDLRIARSASLLTCLGLLAMSVIYKIEASLPLTALFLLLNGSILFLAERTRQGNKDSRSFSRLDALGIGIVGVLSVFPGISRVGMSLSYAQIRGADKRHASRWVFLMSVPVLIVLLCCDIFSIATAGILSFDFTAVASYISAGVFSFAGALIAIRTMDYLSVSTGFSVFSYYSWGVALFCIVLYLIT